MIRKALIADVDQDFGVYDGETFKEAWFAKYLSRTNTPWLLSESGRLKLDDETFKERALLCPEIEPLRMLRKTLVQAREIKLSVGADGRNRFMQSPSRHSQEDHGDLCRCCQSGCFMGERQIPKSLHQIFPQGNVW